MSKLSPYRERQLLQATKGLGYKLTAPPATTPVSGKPFWMQLQPDPAQELSQGIVEEKEPVSRLRAQLHRFGQKPQGRSRADLAQQLVTAFLDPVRLRETLESLNPEIQAFYTQLLLNINLSPWSSHPERLILLQSLSKPVEEFYAEVLEAGLALDSDGTLYIPEVLFQRLPPLYLPDSPYRAALPLPAVSNARPQHLMAQIQQLLGLIQTETYSLRPLRRWQSQSPSYHHRTSGWLPTPASARQFVKSPQGRELKLELLAPEPRLMGPTLETWSRILGLPETGVEFLYHLLLTVGVLRPGSPIMVEPAIMERFLSLTPGEQISLLVRASCTTPNWGAFWQQWRTGEVHLHWNRRLYYNEPNYPMTLARTLNSVCAACLQYLAFFSPEVWLSVDAVVKLLTHFFSDGQQLISSSQTLEFSDNQGNWSGFLSLYLQSLLRGPLHWLGVADVALAPDQSLAAFRLHSLQDILWERAPAFPLPEATWKAAQAVRWQGQDELQLALPVPVAVLRQAQRWAEPLGTKGEYLRYRLHLQRLYAAFETGETPETLRDAWEESAGAPPPEPLMAWWDKWWACYGHVRLYPHQAVLITQDDFTMQELQVALPRFRGTLQGMLNPRIALLHPERVDFVLQTLEQRGYLPKEER